MNARIQCVWRIGAKRKWQVLWGIGLAGLLVAALGANSAKAGSSELVVGVERWPLYDDDMLRKETANLAGGTQVSVVQAPGNRIEVEVRTASGVSGFIHRFALCTAGEYQRRKTHGEIPDSIAKFVHKDGSFYMTPVTGYVDISIGNDTPRPRAGQAYWMDESTQGRSFYIASKQVYGNHLYLLKADGSLADLPFWFGPGQGAGGNDKTAEYGVGLILGLIQWAACHYSRYGAGCVVETAATAPEPYLHYGHAGIGNLPETESGGNQNARKPRPRANPRSAHHGVIEAWTSTKAISLGSDMRCRYCSPRHWRFRGCQDAGRTRLTTELRKGRREVFVLYCDQGHKDAWCH